MDPRELGALRREIEQLKVERSLLRARLAKAQGVNDKLMVQNGVLMAERERRASLDLTGNLDLLGPVNTDARTATEAAASGNRAPRRRKKGGR